MLVYFLRYKVAGPSLEYGGKRVAESSGKQLIKKIGRTTVLKETAKRVALKTTEGVAFAVANTAVDTVVENHLQSMLNSLASDILSGVKGEAANHKVAHNLQKAYDRLGENDARANRYHKQCHGADQPNQSSNGLAGSCCTS